MATGEIHVGDTGTVFERTVLNGGTPMDISQATLRQFIFMKPDKTSLTIDAEFATDGTDGVLRCTSTSTMLDQPGYWKLQVHIVTATSDRKSDIDIFTVTRNLV